MAFGVTVDFNANVAKFDKSVNKLNGDLTKFSQKTESAFSGAKKAVLGFAGAFGVVKFGSFVKAGIDTADMLSKLADRTGIAVENLAGLKLAADLSDTSLQEVGRAINKLSIFMGQNADAAEQLGLSAEKPITAFLQFADLFTSIEDEQQRAALGNKVLGQSYARLAPLLLQGSDALKQQIQQGKEYLPVSEAMAKQSADFNDNLTKLSASTSQYAIILAGPIVTGFNGLIQKMEEATRSGATFNNVLTGLSNFVFDNQSFTGFAKSIADINDKIVAQREKVRVLQNEGGLGGLVDGLLGYDPGEERRKLDLLLRDRQQLLIDFKQKTDAQNVDVNGPSDIPDGQQINQALGLNKGKSTPAAKVSTAIAEATGPASEWVNLMHEAEAVINSTRTPLENLNSEIELYSTLADRGFINQETLNRALQDSGENYNNLTGKVAIASDQMTVFADQAARNMQDAFAQFLFDPFSEGIDGMLLGFANILRQMAAEAAAAQVFDLFKSKDSGGSGLGGAILGGIFSAFGGGSSAAVKHAGGMVGGAGASRVVSPLAFAGAQRFHNGGFPGLRSDEVPAILQKGERVLSRKEVAAGGVSAGNVYNIAVTVKSSDGESASRTGQKAAEAMARAIARQEIQSASRPGNQLNQTTKFG